MASLAIIGTGIAGLSCAHFLHRHFDLTVFERAGYAGGHTNTIEVEERIAGSPARRLAMDTGFMVFNRVTYPLLDRLFNELGVSTQPAPMSFSVRHAGSGLEYSGSSLNHLFAQRQNLFRPRFWRMLSAIQRFNAEAIAALANPAASTLTLGDYVRQRGYGDDFFNLYLLPMSSAVWSTPPERMLAFPATTLLRFFHNHGFLGLNTQHPWRTVTGGARTYVKKIAAPWRDRIRLGEAAIRIDRAARGVSVTSSSGRAAYFDRVILACHADDALGLLAHPSHAERRVLRQFKYLPNVATVHTDSSVMPRTQRAWSSWNYEIAEQSSGHRSTATHYWMNSLQGVSDRENYFVSINRPQAIAPEKVIRRISYAHPLFSLAAVEAQRDIPALNAAACGRSETYFAGAWQRYGFHEDGLWSAVRLSEQLLGRDPWTAGEASEHTAAPVAASTWGGSDERGASAAPRGT